MSVDLDLKLDFVKVRLAGDHGIGKTSLMSRFLGTRSSPPPKIVSFVICEPHLGSHLISQLATYPQTTHFSPHR
jgi:GTPase SAR1 family protein